MIEIVYFSNITGYTHKFIEKLNWEAAVHRIPVKGSADFEIVNPYIIICPSYGSDTTGHVPPQVKRFLNDPIYRENCVGVIGAGNINFGAEFARSGDMIAQKLNIPLLYKFELAGTTADVKSVREGLLNFEIEEKSKQTIRT